MKAFLVNLWAKIMTILVAIRHAPVVEPLLDVLKKERTIVLLSGFAGFRLVPELFPRLTIEQQMFVGTLVVAAALFMFVGLQREVWKEAEQDVTTLPKNDAGYISELLQQIMLGLAQQPKQPETIPPTG